MSVSIIFCVVKSVAKVAIKKETVDKPILFLALCIVLNITLKVVVNDCSN
jgi:hypothetical protein